VTGSPKRYKNAPITEAVLEIRVEALKPLDPSMLKNFADSLKGDFPKQAPMQLLQVGIAGPQQLGQVVSQTFSQSHVGMRLAKSDDSRVLQIRQDGFAFSHMAPYTEWAIFRKEAEPLWRQYRAICQDAKLARCALRYINRIDIPILGKSIEIFDYFRLYPKIPDELPQQDVIGMVLNVQMPQHDLECVASINQALIEPVKPNHISFVLDIDIYRLGIQTWQDAAVWQFLDELRRRKNEIFEGCITDRTRELIDQ
jgi:uncharacterized protein (TIGR04255 family)